MSANRATIAIENIIIDFTTWIWLYFDQLDLTNVVPKLTFGSCDNVSSSVLVPLIFGVMIVTVV